MLEVSTFEVNGGEVITFRRGTDNVPVSLANQNSVVRHLLVEFSAPVTLAAGAFTLATKSVTVNNAPSPSTVAPGVSWKPMPGSNGAAWIISFSGPGSDAATGKIANGVYDLTIDASKVTSASGSLAGNETRTFAALFGCRVDIDDNTGASTALVDSAQVSLFTRCLGRRAGDAGFPGYCPAADFNLDGYCDPADSFAISETSGTSWTWGGIA